MKLAMTDMDIVWEDKAANRAWCEKSMAEAAKKGADVILFPEMTLTGFSMDVEKIRDREGEDVRFFAGAAREYRLAVGFGYVSRTGEKGRNHFCLLNRRGEVLADYEKIHPFTCGGEAAAYEGGDTICHTVVEGMTCGLFICYDLRFPEAFQRLPMDTDAVFVIANWPRERLPHWYALLRARAIEMQCYVAGINRIGSGGGLTYEKSSAVFSPDGILLPATAEKYNRYVEIHRESRLSYIREFSTRRDRRPDIYRE